MTLAGTLALIGLPGSGKSTVAPLLGARLGVPWTDLDERIAQAAGTPVPELLRRRGEAPFRAAEEAALRAALDQADARPAPVAGAAPPGAGGGRRRPGLVLACGGGAVVHEGSRALLRERAFVVWLQVGAEAAAARLGVAGAGGRPLLSGAGTLAERLESLGRARAPHYGAAAHASVATDGLTPSEVAAEVERAWDSSGS